LIKAELYYRQEKAAGALPKNLKLVCFFDDRQDDFFTLGWDQEPVPGEPPSAAQTAGTRAEMCSSIGGYRPVCFDSFRMTADLEKTELTLLQVDPKQELQEIQVYLPTGRFSAPGDRAGTCRKITG
jgi:hypothetical protein